MHPDKALLTSAPVCGDSPALRPRCEAVARQALVRVAAELWEYPNCLVFPSKISQDFA